MFRKIISSLVYFIFFATLYAVPANLLLLEKAYPDIKIECNYNHEKDDYVVKVELDGRNAEFLWAEGRMLPETEAKNKEKYRSIFYYYDNKVQDPKDFTEEDIEFIKKYSSSENRKNGDEMPPFFFDFIYDSSTRIKVEQHIVSVKFLGKSASIHSRIKEPLKKVEEKILALSKEDEEVKKFIQNLSRVDCYNWREISDSGKKSTHSLGIAFDILPKGWNQKNLYWAWRRDIDGDNWMKLPVERRWYPPQKVIDAFESEGFIYGGNWIIWDNMHFEYFPEVIIYSNLIKSL